MCVSKLCSGSLVSVNSWRVSVQPSLVQQGMEFKCANCLRSHQNPKLLCCFHVFCDNCLSLRMEKDHRGRSCLSCPICHLVTFVSAEHVCSLPTVETSYCLEHKSSDLELYCKNCNTVICSQCTSEKHSNHDYALISSIFPAHKGEIEAKLVHLNNRLISVNKSMVQLDAQTTAVSTKEKLAESSVSNVARMVEEAMQSRSQQLCNQLHAIAHDRFESISSRKRDLTIVQAQLSSCLGFVRETLRSSSQKEIMMMKSTLLRQIEMLLSGRRKVSFADPPEEFNMKLDASPQSLVKSCLDLGRITSSSHSTSAKCRDQLPQEKKLANNLELSKLLVKRLSVPLLTLTDLKGPCGIAVNQNGEVMVAEGCADCISVFSLDGKKLRSFGQCGSALGDFACPCELDIDDDDNILVVDGSNRRIQKFTSDGKFLASAGSNGVGVLQFSEPDGIAVHPVTKNIYVVDNNTHRIQILNPDLTFLKMFGKEGSGRGYLHYPWGVACSCSGEVYVTDSGNCCVQVFTPDGQFLREFGRKGSGQGEFKWPTGISISVDGGIVFVSDYGNHRVSIFTSDGQFLKSIGRKGKRHGEFGNIRGVKVDRNGLVYVCDTDNNRVVLY